MIKVLWSVIIYLSKYVSVSGILVPDNETKALNCFVVTFFTHVKSYDFGTIWNNTSLPDWIIGVTPMQVENSFSLIIKELHCVHEVLVSPYFDTDFTDRPRCVYVSRLQYPLTMICSSCRFTCRKCIFLEDWRLNSVSELELNALQNIIVSPVDALQLDRRIEMQLLQVSLCWEFKALFHVLSTEHLQLGQFWLSGFLFEITWNEFLWGVSSWLLIVDNKIIWWHSIVYRLSVWVDLRRHFHQTLLWCANQFFQLGLLHLDELCNIISFLFGIAGCLLVVCFPDAFVFI